MCFQMIGDSQVNVILAQLVPPVERAGSPHPFYSPQTQFHTSLKAGSQVLCKEMVVGNTTFIKQEILLGQ